MEKTDNYVCCHECKEMYDCEMTYLGGCTDGEKWDKNGQTMKTITFDGSKIFSINRENSGQVNISICENEVGLKVGQVRECRLEEVLNSNCIARLELPNKQTYINLCRALLSYADRSELVKIIGNPISWAGYAVKERKRRTKK